MGKNWFQVLQLVHWERNNQMTVENIKFQGWFIHNYLYAWAGVLTAKQVLQLTGVTPLSDLQWRQLCLNSFSLPANSSSYSCFSQDTVPKTAASLFHPLYKQTRGSLCLGTIITLFNIFLFCNCGYSRISNSLVCRVRILFAVWIFLSYKPCTTSMKSLWSLPQNLSICFRYS